MRARLRAAEEADRAAWDQIRLVMLAAVGESTFEIWLAPLELLAVDLDGALVVSAHRETIGWVARRFGRILDSAAGPAGRRLRIADELEREAAEALSSTIAARLTCQSAGPLSRCVASRADAPSDRSGDTSADGSAYPSSYTDVYHQFEVSS